MLRKKLMRICLKKKNIIINEDYLNIYKLIFFIIIYKSGLKNIFIYILNSNLFFKEMNIF